MCRRQIEISKDEIIHVLEQYIHNLKDRKVMINYLTEYPDSLLPVEHSHFLRGMDAAVLPGASDGSPGI